MAGAFFIESVILWIHPHIIYNILHFVLLSVGERLWESERIMSATSIALLLGKYANNNTAHTHSINNNKEYQFLPHFILRLLGAPNLFYTYP